MAKHGLVRLWRGAPVMMVGCIPSHAAYFSVYERAKIAFGVNKPGHSPLAAAACGAMATTLHDAVLTPLDVVKQRLQLGFYDGVTDCVRTIIKQEGVGALFRSYPTTLLMNWPYASVLVATNETIKETMRQARGPGHKAGKDDPLSGAEFLLSGALAGAVAAAVTTPLDVLKTRLQTQGLSVAAPLAPTVDARPSARRGGGGSAGPPPHGPGGHRGAPGSGAERGSAGPGAGGHGTGADASGSRVQHGRWGARALPTPAWAAETAAFHPQPAAAAEALGSGYRRHQHQHRHRGHKGHGAGNAGLYRAAGSAAEHAGGTLSATAPVPRPAVAGTSWSGRALQRAAGADAGSRLARLAAVPSASHAGGASSGVARRFAMGFGARGCARLGAGAYPVLPGTGSAGSKARVWGPRASAARRTGASIATAFRADWTLHTPSPPPDDLSSRASATSERDVATARAQRPRVALRMPAGVPGIADLHLVRGSAPQYTGLVDAARKVVGAEGVRGLFRGMGARMAVHAPSAAISWGTYEALKNALRPITG